jgi:hypothetical protein
MSADTHASGGEPAGRPVYRRRLFWLAGSLLAAAALLLSLAWPQAPERPAPDRGIHLRSLGIISATNTIIIEDGAELPKGEPIFMESRGGITSNVLHLKKRP